MIGGHCRPHFDGCALCVEVQCLDAKELQPPNWDVHTLLQSIVPLK